MPVRSDFYLGCARTLSSRDLAQCKPLGFTIVDWLAVVVSLGSICSGVYWIITKLIRPLLKKRDGEFRTFRSLRRAIRPLMVDNHRIFSEFGPNSDVNARGEVRHDLSVWKRMRVRVGENNQAIAKLIRGNQSIIPKKFQDNFRNWLLHIDAFASHLEDSSVDYRRHQFPSAISAIILGQ